MPLYIKQSGDLDRYHAVTEPLQTLKHSATQLLIKYKEWSSRNGIRQTFGVLMR